MVCFRSCQELVAELGPEPSPRVPSPVSGVGAAEEGQGGERGSRLPGRGPQGPGSQGHWGGCCMCHSGARPPCALHPASPKPGLLWGCGFSFQEEICLLCSQFPPPSRKHPHPPSPTTAAQIAPTFRSYVSELSGAPAAPALLRHTR